MASASSTTQTTPLANSFGDDVDPLDGLYASVDGHLGSLQSEWSVPVYFDGVLGFETPPDLLSFSSEEHRDGDTQFIFDPSIYPPTESGLKELLAAIKKLLMSRVLFSWEATALVFLYVNVAIPTVIVPKKQKSTRKTLCSLTRFGYTRTTMMH